MSGVLSLSLPTFSLLDWQDHAQSSFVIRAFPSLLFIELLLKHLSCKSCLSVLIFLFKQYWKLLRSDSPDNKLFVSISSQKSRRTRRREYDRRTPETAILEHRHQPSGSNRRAPSELLKICSVRLKHFQKTTQVWLQLQYSCSNSLICNSLICNSLICNSLICNTLQQRSPW